MAEPAQPGHRMVVTHFIVSDDVERSRRFYTEVLGGTVVFGPEPTYVALANTYIIINFGGGPTNDKPIDAANGGSSNACPYPRKKAHPHR